MAKNALFICVCFSDRDCKRYEGGDWNRAIYFELPYEFIAEGGGSPYIIQYTTDVPFERMSLEKKNALQKGPLLTFWLR